MSKTAKTKSARIRESLSHPIIDGDGHIMELGPVIMDYLKQSAGPRVARRFEKIMTKDGGPWGWYAQSEKQRRDHEAALARLTGAGAIPLTVEMILFEWTLNADSAEFKSILPIVK